MKFRFDGFNWIVRLDMGEKLIESLSNLVKAEKIPSCWVSGIGAVQSVELGYYDLNSEKYEWHSVNELMEITGLQGSLAWDDNKPVWHIHGSFGKKDLSLIGGHVKELVVGGTCEVFLHKWYADNLTRTSDPNSELRLLDL